MSFWIPQHLTSKGSTLGFSISFDSEFALVLYILPIGISYENLGISRHFI